VSNVGTLTITHSGGTTFSGTVGASIVTLTNTTGTIAFNGALTATTLNTAAQAYNLALNASTGTITDAVTFINTGTLTLGTAGGTLVFTNGLTATAPSARTLKGTISSTNAPMTFGAITLGADTSLNTNATTNVADLTIGAVTGATYGLTLATGGVTGAEISGSSISGVGTLIITNSGGTTFSGTVGATTVTLSNTTGTITFNGALTATTLNTANQAYNLALNASTGTITNAVTFSNSGTLTLGTSGGTLAFTNGLTALAPSTKYLSGTIAANNSTSVINLATTPVSILANTTIGGTATGAISLGATTLADNVTLTLGTGISNAINLSSVAGTDLGLASNLTINTTGAVAVSSTIGTDIGTLTITNSGGTTFSGAVGSSASPITSLVLTATTGTIEFSDNLYATAITNSAGSFALKLYGSTTSITNATTFGTSGALFLGNSATDAFTFAGGLTAIVPSGISLGGTINTNSAAVSLGATSKTLTLVANSVINTYANGGAGTSIAINGPIEGTNIGLEALSLKAKGGTISVVGSIGATTRIGTLTLGDSAQTGAVTINGAINAQTLVVGESGGTNAFAITLYNMGTSSAAAIGTTNITTTADFYNTGAIQLGDHASDIFNFLGGLTIGNSSGVTIKAQSLNATASPLYINVPTRFTFSTTLSPTTGRITLGAVTIDDGYTLTLGSGAATPMTLSSISGTALGVPSGVTFNTTAAITVSGAIGTDIGSFTITNSGGITFNGPVGANGNRITSMAITASTGLIEFKDNLYAGALSNAGGDVAIKFYGSTTDVTSAVTLNTTGDVYYGDATSDVLTFSRGITHITGNNILLGTFTAGNPTECNSGTTCSFNMGGTTSFLSSTSTFDFGSSSITLNNVILGDGVTLYLGGGNSGAITVASITGTAGGASSNVVINNTGAVSITGAIGTDIGTLTLTNSGGATFGSTVATGTSIVISSTTGTVAFNGAVTTPTLSVDTGAYNLGLNATGY
jgi:hypothetical protein